MVNCKQQGRETCFYLRQSDHYASSISGVLSIPRPIDAEPLTAIRSLGLSSSFPRPIGGCRLSERLSQASFIHTLVALGDIVLIY